MLLWEYLLTKWYSTYWNVQISKFRKFDSNIRENVTGEMWQKLTFIGLLLLSGYKKQNHTQFLELWTADGIDSEIFRAYMGKNRFLLLLSAIRFDDRSTRNRKQIDKLAAIRWIIDEFVKNCKNNYSVGEFITIVDTISRTLWFCTIYTKQICEVWIESFYNVWCENILCIEFGNLLWKKPDGLYNTPDTPTAIVHRLLEEVKGTNRNLMCIQAIRWQKNY